MLLKYLSGRSEEMTVREIKCMQKFKVITFIQTPI